MKPISSICSFFIAGILLAGCRTPSSSPAATPQTGPTTTIPVASTLPASSDAVLRACRAAGDQVAAMNENSPQNLSTLGLTACYDLQLNWSPDTSTIQGAAKITFTNLESAPLTEIVMRLYPNADVIYNGSMDIQAVTVNEITQNFQVEGGDQTILNIPLQQPLESMQTLRLSITYSAHLPTEYTAAFEYGIFHYTPSNSLAVAANAYPMLAQRKSGMWITQIVLPEGDAVVSNSSLYLAQIDLPIGWQAVTSGVQLDCSDDVDRHICRYATGPMRDFMLVMGSTIESIESTVDGVRIVHWNAAGKAENREEGEKIAGDSLRIFDQRFGQYPYRELDVVSAELRNASGVEYPGLILMADNLYTERQQSLPVVMAHEVAHQWWYSVVGNDVLENPWQDEAMATFSSLLYPEMKSSSYYQGVLSDFNNRVKQFEGSNPPDLKIYMSVAQFSGHEAAYSPVVYFKGALFLVNLREKIGDDAFFAALQQYYHANEFQSPPPTALLSSFEKSCQCQLATFYREWGAIP